MVNPKQCKGQCYDDALKMKSRKKGVVSSQFRHQQELLAIVEKHDPLLGLRENYVTGNRFSL